MKAPPTISSPVKIGSRSYEARNLIPLFYTLCSYSSTEDFVQGLLVNRLRWMYCGVMLSLYQTRIDVWDL
jgi:hypothetical protein